MNIISPISTWNLTNKKVFLRADLNVPLNHGTILDDTRLREIQPTLDYLITHGATIILATHIGRPVGNDPAYATQQLVSWFTNKGYTIAYHPTLDSVPIVPGKIFLIPNLRYYAEEKKSDAGFAKKLASLAHYFVQEAFGTLHRTDTSIALLPLQFKPQDRSLGFLVIKELAVIATLEKPVHPFTIIMGGGKAADKIPVITNLISKIDHLLLCPALVFTFLKARGIAVGKSLVDDTVINVCKKIIDDYGHKLVFPSDLLVAHGSIDGALSVKDLHDIHLNDIGISIGPKTIAHFGNIIHQSKTVFFNGAIGFIERKETLVGMEKLFQAMGESSATSIIAGGDSIAAANKLGIQGITHYLTGGGSALALLSRQELPGLKPFLKHRTKTNKAKTIQ